MLASLARFVCASVGCDCRGGHCDPRTGECRCAEGMTGKQCDTCTHTYSVPVEQHNVVHCEGQHSHTVPLCKSGETHFFYNLCVCFSVCDSCVVVLLEDLDQLEGNFHSVSDQLSSLNASAMAWTQLYRLNISLEDAAVSTHTYTVFCCCPDCCVQ